MRLTLVFTFTVLLLGLSHCSAPEPEHGLTEAQLRDVKVATLSINGMTCHGCAASVEAALLEAPGVVQAVVSRDDQTAWVYVEKDSSTDQALLTSVVDEKGYKVVECSWLL